MYLPFSEVLKNKQTIYSIQDSAKVVYCTFVVVSLYTMFAALQLELNLYL